ncbi:MAG: hypothetical protein QW728_02600, partial [Thermoplasmata archaeon]
MQVEYQLLLGIIISSIFFLIKYIGFKKAYIDLHLIFLRHEKARAMNPKLAKLKETKEMKDALFFGRFLIFCAIMLAIVLIFLTRYIGWDYILFALVFGVEVAVFVLFAIIMFYWSSSRVVVIESENAGQTKKGEMYRSVLGSVRVEDTINKETCPYCGASIG